MRTTKKKQAEAKTEAEVHLNLVELHELAHLEVEHLNTSAIQVHNDRDFFWYRK